MYILRKYTAKFSIVNYTTRVTFEVNITQMDKFTYSRTEYQKPPIHLIKNLIYIQNFSEYSRQEVADVSGKKCWLLLRVLHQLTRNCFMQL